MLRGPRLALNSILHNRNFKNWVPLDDGPTPLLLRAHPPIHIRHGATSLAAMAAALCMGQRISQGHNAKVSSEAQARMAKHRDSSDSATYRQAV